MNFLNYQSQLKILLKNHRSCSLVNAEGALLYSKDTQPELLTTTRLVAFQIVKKYLSPKPRDLFFLNDPENGGYQNSKLVFLACLHSNLFLIWDEDYFHINFKIPPTPLFDQGKKNDFVWQALTASHPYGADLEAFFEYQKYSVDKIMTLSQQLEALANPKNQQLWLKTTNEIFSIQFNNKAHGSFEAQYKPGPGQCIKLKFTAEERQNIKLITLDFTNTTSAIDLHASSHVIESALVKKIIDYYQLGEYFTQAVLDKIKIILPPKSIVSKPHATGDRNFELQAICQQLCDYDLQQLNSHARKSQAAFEYQSFLSFDISHASNHSHNLITAQAIVLNNFEQLAEAGLIQIKKMRRHDGGNHIIFEVSPGDTLELKINNNYKCSPKPELLLKINDAAAERGKHKLTSGDVVEIFSA